MTASTTARLDMVALDTRDIDALASFYADLTGWEIVKKTDRWVRLRTDDGQEIGFQCSPEHIAPEWPGQDLPQQFHLDITVDGHEAATERAVALGATRLAAGASWITLADPAGHPFDLCQNDTAGPGMHLYAATIDALDPSALARFYADLLGTEVAYDGPEGALVVGEGKSIMFQRVETYTAPVWQDPKRPQQAHLDLLVDDLDAGEQRVAALGGTRLSGGGDDFRVFADPAGHPFCLVTVPAAA